jgi:hypothetical protein
MPALQPARGTQDLLPEMARRHRRARALKVLRARQLRGCGGRLPPSGDKFVGTSAIARPRMVAFTTISLANAIPSATLPGLE